MKVLIANRKAVIIKFLMLHFFNGLKIIQTLFACLIALCFSPDFSNSESRLIRDMNSVLKSACPIPLLNYYAYTHQ